MRGLLAQGDAFPRCLSDRMMTYAIGRTMGADDTCAVAQIGAEAVTPADATLSDLLWSVVTSSAFRSEEIAGQG